MAFKASLKIILKADETVVAESDDPTLWQNTLLAINGENKSRIVINPPNSGENAGKENPDAIDKFAEELGVDRDILIGACSPSFEKPYIHLDKHHWEEIKKSPSGKGVRKIGNLVIASSILILWKDIAKLGDVTQIEISEVLNTINVRDKNPTRSLNNCKWLQMRNTKYIINPSMISNAINLVKAYCLKNQPR